MLFFFFQRIIKAIGRPISEPVNIDKRAMGYVRTIPKIKSSFISPPPIDSFLKMKSPNFFNRNMVNKARKPFNSEYRAASSPFIKRISTNRMMANVINTSSDIIR